MNCDFFFTQLLGIDSFEKRKNIIGGHAWSKFFMVLSKLKAMTIYVVKKGLIVGMI